jgi:hypothetical protein
MGEQADGAVGGGSRVEVNTAALTTIERTAAGFLVNRLEPKARRVARRALSRLSCGEPVRRVALAEGRRWPDQNPSRMIFIRRGWAELSGDAVFEQVDR